jgi:hypothetical protein
MQRREMNALSETTGDLQSNTKNISSVLISKHNKDVKVDPLYPHLIRTMPVPYIWLPLISKGDILKLL